MGNPHRLPRRPAPDPAPAQPSRTRDPGRALPAHRCTGKLTPIGQLKPHPANPNTHPAEQLRLYQKIIHHQGWRRPIVVSRRSGYIIKGHGAWQAARAAGWGRVPVELQDYESEAAELTDLLADNQLARYSESNPELLDQLLAELKSHGGDPELAGLFHELEEIAAEAAPLIPEAPTFQILITCQNEQQQINLLLDLTAEGESCRALIS